MDDSPAAPASEIVHGPDGQKVKPATPAAAPPASAKAVEGGRRAHPFANTSTSARFAIGRELQALHHELVLGSRDGPGRSDELSRMIGLVALATEEAFAVHEDRTSDGEFGRSVDGLCRSLEAVPQPTAITVARHCGRIGYLRRSLSGDSSDPR